MASQLGSLPSVRSVMKTYLSRMSRNIEDLSPKVALLMGIGERGQAHQVGMWTSGQGDQLQPVDLSSKPLQNLHVFLVDPVAPEVPYFNHLKKEHPRLKTKKRLWRENFSSEGTKRPTRRKQGSQPAEGRNAVSPTTSSHQHQKEQRAEWARTRGF